jgi:predicted methyltransferase
MTRLLAMLTLVLSASLAPLTESTADDRLREAVDDPARPDAQAERDPHRHPYETLTFFGIEPDMTVVELAPGGGWYTEILAPYLAAEGQYVGAHIDPDAEGLPDFYYDMYERWADGISDTERYGDVEIVGFVPPEITRLGEPGSADMVVTFRSTHGWKRDGVFGDVLQAANEVLKPGGVLGLVQHRLPEDAANETNGYVRQSWVVAQAEANGFRLVESSDINANPDDSADHPNGVWNLPPTLRVDDGDDPERYAAIGESDRMTLKFVKR